MNFNSHKSWHVNSKGNRDKLEKMEQRDDEQSAANKGKKREREKERDLEDARMMALKHQNKGEQSLNFMYQPPPGLVKDPEKQSERPEDAIPDTPENKEAREFLKNAPARGLWLPLGKEVKVMMCFRCKNYGHRTGEKECPLYGKGNSQVENERLAREDPMASYMKQREQETQVEAVEKKHNQKQERLQQLKDMLAKAEKRYMKKKLKKSMKKKEEKKKRDKKHRKKDSDSSSGSDSSSDSDSSDDRDRGRDRDRDGKRSRRD